MKIVGDENILFLKESFSRLGEVTALPSQDITAKSIKDADVLLVRSVTKVNRELLKGSFIKFVGTATIGIDHIDVDYLKNKGITLASAPGSNSNAVAEYIIACLLVLAQRKGFTLRGKTIGIIGVGNIGSKVAKKCLGLGMNPLLNDPPLARKTRDKKYLPLSALFGSDIITLHVPLTYKGKDATYHIVNKSFLSKMLAPTRNGAGKGGTILINTSRGGIVDEPALLEGIEKLKAVVLDVWENEPDINIELLKKVELGTPHIAGYSLEGKAQATAMLYRGLCGFLELCGFLNKKDKWSPISLLPPSPKVWTEYIQPPQEEIIREIVKGFYDIEEDDRRLRKIVAIDKRGEYFNHLRKDYKLRREFQNTIFM